MRNNLTRSLSGQSNPTPRSTRNSIDGDGGGQLHIKIVKGGGLAGEPCIRRRIAMRDRGRADVGMECDSSSDDGGPPSHKPHKRITLELREKMTTLRDLKDIVRGPRRRAGDRCGGCRVVGWPRREVTYFKTVVRGLTTSTDAETRLELWRDRTRSRLPAAQEAAELRQRAVLRCRCKIFELTRCALRPLRHEPKW